MPPISTIIQWASAAGAAIAGVVQGARRVLGRKYPTADEVVAQMERDRREQYERLKRDAGIADEKTPIERPSKLPPRGLR